MYVVTTRRLTFVHFQHFEKIRVNSINVVTKVHEQFSSWNIYLESLEVAPISRLAPAGGKGKNIPRNGKKLQMQEQILGINCKTSPASGAFHQNPQFYNNFSYFL